MRAYLALFCGVSATVIGGLGALNYAVDPYQIHQWDTVEVQRMRPQREKLSAWSKTYALARYRPTIVYIGNSRTEMGLPVPPHQDKPVFNAALSGASIGDAARMAHHAAAMGPLDTVVWGIDAPSFSLDAGNTDLDGALGAPRRDAHLAALGSASARYLAERAWRNAVRGVTVDMTRDTLLLLGGRLVGECRASLALYGQRDPHCLDGLMAAKGGASTAIPLRMAEFVRGIGPTDDGMAVFDARVTALCDAGTRVRLYINPTHALMLDTLYWAGRSNAVDAWLAALTAMTERLRAQACDVRLVDFSGYNSITTETVPLAGNGAFMRYYWETSHYRDNVGRMILARLTGDRAALRRERVPDDFGVELTAASLPQHLAKQAAARTRYHADHRAECALSQRIAAAAGRRQ